MKVAPVAASLAAKGSYLRIVAQVPNDPQPLGIGFGKNRAAPLAAVNGELAVMRREGRMNQLKEKWGRAVRRQSKARIRHPIPSNK